jgi:hypothetical protein
MLFIENILKLFAQEVYVTNSIYPAYVRRMDIINRGFRSVDQILLWLNWLTINSGYNTDHGLVCIENVLPTPAQATVRFLVCAPAVQSYPSPSKSE